MDLVVAPLGPSSAGDDLLAWWNRYAELPETYQHRLGLAELRERELHPGGRLQQWDWWVVRRGSSILGTACLERFALPEHNRDAEIDLLLEPGADVEAGRALLRRALAPAIAGGRDRIMSWNPDIDIQRALWNGLGARLAQPMSHSRLSLNDTDPARMEQWDRPPEGYRIHSWRGRCPESLIAVFCAARRLINDAPLDELEYPEMAYSEEFVRASEDLSLDSGGEPWVVLAQAPDGGIAGFTEVTVNLHSPDHSQQSDTAVHHDHRRRGLGRALKARMWRWLRSEAPEVAGLTTENAASNSPMLKINDEMGFRAGPRYAIWQLPLDRLLRGLG